MGPDSSDRLSCRSSQSAGWGGDSEVGAGAGKVTKVTLDGQSSVSWGQGRVLSPLVLCGFLSHSPAYEEASLVCDQARG